MYKILGVFEVPWVTKYYRFYFSIPKWIYTVGEKGKKM